MRRFPNLSGNASDQHSRQTLEGFPVERRELVGHSSDGHRQRRDLDAGVRESRVVLEDPKGARLGSQDTAPIRRPQRMTFASVIGSRHPMSRSRPGLPLVVDAPAGARNRLARRARSGGSRSFGIAPRIASPRPRARGDAQEGVEGGRFAGLEAPQGAHADPGIFGQRGLCHIVGKSQSGQTRSDLGFNLSGYLHMFSPAAIYWPLLSLEFCPY